jgi:hypothetical protein
MQVTIIQRDTQKGTAKIKFEHNGITHTDTYDLAMVVPGTKLIFEQYGVEFDEAKQQQIIDKLTVMVQTQIEAGILHNPV